MQVGVVVSRTLRTLRAPPWSFKALLIGPHLNFLFITMTSHDDLGTGQQRRAIAVRRLDAGRTRAVTLLATAFYAGLASGPTIWTST